MRVKAIKGRLNCIQIHIKEVHVTEEEHQQRYHTLPNVIQYRRAIYNQHRNSKTEVRNMAHKKLLHC